MLQYLCYIIFLENLLIGFTTYMVKRLTTTQEISVKMDEYYIMLSVLYSSNVHCSRYALKRDPSLSDVQWLHCKNKC